MDQPQAQLAARDKVAYQLGFQLLSICELQAQREHLEQQLVVVTAERDALKAEKAGASGT